MRGARAPRKKVRFGKSRTHCPPAVVAAFGAAAFPPFLGVVGDDEEEEEEEAGGHLSGALKERGPSLKVAPRQAGAGLLSAIDDGASIVTLGAMEGVAVATSTARAGEGVGARCWHDEWRTPN